MLRFLSVAVSVFGFVVTSAAQISPPPLSNPFPSRNQTVQLNPGSVSLDSLSVEQLVERGDLARARKEYLDAIDCYRAAIKKQPSSAVYNKQALAYILMGRPKEGRKALERAVRLNRENADAWNNLAVTYYMQRKYPAAIHNMQKAIGLRPESAPFHSSLGTMYMDRKDFSKAMSEYRRALELDPAVFERSSPYGVSGRLSSPEDRAHFNFELARLYAASGDFDHALLSLRRAMEDGYPGINAVYKDKEFARLRGDERFLSLMKDRPVQLTQE